METSLLCQLVEPYRVTSGQKFKLGRFNPADTGQMHGKQDAQKLLRQGVAELQGLQDRLYAQSQWSILLIFQAMDAAGKDGTIKHVMSGINPQGCQVFSFKEPTSKELDHNYLWRCQKCLPERGRIGIFNRSYYEETLIVRVHPEILQRQKLPPSLIRDSIWEERFEDIRNFERHLARNGTIVRKFFLHLSKDEQKRRFLDRIQRKEKNWKFSEADVRERSFWDAYQDAYTETIRHTATEDAPWFVVPADHKWFARLVVSAAIIETLQSLDLRYPELDPAGLKALARAQKML